MPKKRRNPVCLDRECPVTDCTVSTHEGALLCSLMGVFERYRKQDQDVHIPRREETP